MKIEWNSMNGDEYIALEGNAFLYAGMEVDGYTDDRVEVYMNLRESGFTVVLIKIDPNDLSRTFVQCKRETYAGALAIAVQIAASIIPVQAILTATGVDQ